MNQAQSTIETYERFGVIDSGSVSTIYEGYDHELKRDIAIKELRPEFREDAEVVEAFWGEATVLAGLNHANILRVYGIDRDRFWVVMEPMQTNIANEGGKAGLAIARVRDILKQVLEGLRYLHAMGRCHGQLPMDSLLVDRQGNIRLSNLSESVNEGEFRCPDEKNLHCAPEILNPKHFGQPGVNADLYSVGILALQLIAGEKFIKLFKGMDRKRQNDPIAWSAWHASSEPVASIQTIVPNVPSDLATLIEGLVQKQAGLRFATASEALGTICPMSFSPTSGGTNGLQRMSGIGEQASFDSATVIYNSPNLYSPIVAGQGEKKSASWQGLCTYVTKQLKLLNNKKTITLASSTVGLLILLMMLIPSKNQNADPKVQQVENPDDEPSAQQFEYDHLFSDLNLQEVEAPQLPLGTLKLIVLKDPKGPSLDTLQVFIDGELQSIRVTESAAAEAIKPAESEQASQYSSKTDADRAAFTLVRKQSDSPIIVNGPVGSIVLEIRAPSYQPWHQEVMIASESTDERIIRLNREIYKVPFEIKPETAKLIIDGVLADSNEGKPRFLELAWGTYVLEITAEGYEGKAERRLIDSEKLQNFELDSIPMVSTVIESFPNGASVQIDGHHVGTTPFLWSGREGEHRIEMSVAGLAPTESKFRLYSETESEVPRRCWYLKRWGSSQMTSQKLTKLEH